MNLLLKVEAVLEFISLLKLKFHLCNLFSLGKYYLIATSRGDHGPIPTITSTRRMILTSRRVPDKQKTESSDVVDSPSAPVIRKTFPESWIFDSIDG